MLLKISWMKRERKTPDMKKISAPPQKKTLKKIKFKNKMIQITPLKIVGWTPLSQHNNLRERKKKIPILLKNIDSKKKIWRRKS